MIAARRLGGLESRDSPRDLGPYKRISKDKLICGFA